MMLKESNSGELQKDVHQQHNYPPGIAVIETCMNTNRTRRYQIFMFIFTFVLIMGAHFTRNPISIVKSVLHQNCSAMDGSTIIAAPIFPANISNTTAELTWCDWAPFDQPNYNALLGSLDYAFLISYAIGMFISGHIADRVNVRYFLAFGQIASAGFTIGFGLGYFFNIHSLVYYIFMQGLAGLFAASGWPCLVVCMGSWYGKKRRGRIMGLWNSHGALGYIFGALIAGIWVNYAWGWSFVVPGIISASLGVLAFLFLVPRPEDVGCSKPTHDCNSLDPSIKPAYVRKNDENSSGPNAEETALSETTPLVEIEPQEKRHKDNAITFYQALQIPGVVEFSMSLFFVKLVSYTFIFWLPNYINKYGFDAEAAGNLATLFYVGGIIGNVIIGVVSDLIHARAVPCFITTLLTTPLLYLTYLFLNEDTGRDVGLLMLCGAFVSGPYALISTTVSADLGTHPSLQGNTKAIATVSSIIDGTGSIGAAIGPALTGLLRNNYPWDSVFYMLMVANVLSMLFLIRLVWKEVHVWILQYRYGL